jgi:pimeloyl-ACP methyl ester carboxylesterase
MIGSRSNYIDRLRKVIKPSDAVFLAVSLIAFGPTPSASQVDFTYDMLAETPADVILDLFKWYRNFDVSERLDEVRVPALVIGGEKDRITMPGASEFLAEGLPKAELKMLPGCGHMSMLERHRDFNTMVTRFLDDVLGKPSETTKVRKKK